MSDLATEAATPCPPMLPQPTPDAGDACPGVYESCACSPPSPGTPLCEVVRGRAVVPLAWDTNRRKDLSAASVPPRREFLDAMLGETEAHRDFYMLLHSSIFERGGTRTVRYPLDDVYLSLEVGYAHKTEGRKRNVYYSESTGWEDVCAVEAHRLLEEAGDSLRALLAKNPQFLKPSTAE